MKSGFDITFDILPGICTHLEPQEIAIFQMVCKSFYLGTKDSYFIDTLIEPLLHRLKNLYPVLCIEAPESAAAAKNPEQSIWRYPLFKSSFKLISVTQKNEVEFHLQYWANYKSSALTQMQEIFTTLPAKTLSTLEKVDALLHEHHFNILKFFNKINPTDVCLDLKNMGLTRLPKQLFEPQYKGYIESIEKILLDDNYIYFLPQEIGQFTHLVYLLCDNNQLKTLPASLGNCANLKWIVCNNNKLQSLPDTLNQCTLLNHVQLNGNRLHSVEPLKGILGEKWADKVLNAQWVGKPITSTKK